MAATATTPEQLAGLQNTYNVLQPLVTLAQSLTAAAEPGALDLIRQFGQPQRNTLASLTGSAMQGMTSQDANRVGDTLVTGLAEWRRQSQFQSEMAAALRQLVRLARQRRGGGLTESDVNGALVAGGDLTVLS